MVVWARQGTSARYTATWSRNVCATREAGIQVGVIAIPNTRIKDPYCQVYKTLFPTLEELAAHMATYRSRRLLQVLQAR
jgi:hypothetical protein